MDEIQFTTVVGADGLIHPPEGISLPEGELEVFVKARKAASPSRESLQKTQEWLLSFAREAEADNPDLPSDMAENHDHYAHGAPKR